MNHVRQVPFGILTKADCHHFDGLCALTASLQTHMPGVPIVALDCGLTDAQQRSIERAGVVLRGVNLTKYHIKREVDQNKFTSAIYALLEESMDDWPVTICLDADTIVLGDISTLAQAAHRSGVAAVADFPPLDLQHQIGEEGALTDVQAIIPNLRVSSIAFNAGVLGIRGDYFRGQILKMVNRLSSLHTSLWGNDQAILNLAAYYANPDQPFERLDSSFNTRPRYRRAPHLEQLVRVDTQDFKGLSHLGKPVRILHFVGHPKPWMLGYPQDCLGLETWRVYRDKAEVWL